MSDRGVCPCGTRLIAHTRWKRMSIEDRATARARGLNAHAGRGLCERCHSRDRRRRRVPIPRGYYTRDEVLTEWQLLYDHRLSIAANCRLIAPRLGMTFAALERAITRARVEGAAA